MQNTKEKSHFGRILASVKCMLFRPFLEIVLLYFYSIDQILIQS